MHIPENYLSPVTCGVMLVAMAPVWVHAVKKVNTELPKEKIPLLGVGAAFAFLGMMLNVPLVGGTTGHAVGGTLIALLFGPDAACIAVSVALLLQAIVFGDGGVLAFGANCFNMAFVLPYAGYTVYKLFFKLMGKKQAAEKNSYVAAALGSYVGINLAAFCAALEFGSQPLLFKDAAGRALYCPYDFTIALPAMVLPHLLIVGFVEALFTVAVFAFIKKTSPDMLYENIISDRHGKATAASTSHLPVFALLAVLMAATPLGLLAEGTAWGEWGAEEIAEVVTNGSKLGYTPQGLAEGWSLSVMMPDYATEGLHEVLGYLLSAILGVSLLIIIFKLLALFLKGRKKYAS